MESEQSDAQKTSVEDHGRTGLTNDEVDKILEEVGFNELKYVEISALQLFFLQFYGTMPFILEAACILAMGIQSYIDFGIIFAILLCNAYLGFQEEIKAKESLVRTRHKDSASFPSK